MDWKRIKSSSAILTGIIIFSKLLGMLRDVVLANYFGTSGISDAYLTASTVPTLLFYFIGHALSTAFLPMYSNMKLSQGKEKADGYANNLLTVSLLLSTVLVVLLVCFPSWIIRIFAPGFHWETVELAASFVRSSALSLYFMTAVSVWTGYLQATNNFIIPASISVPRNLIVMCSISLAAIWDVRILGVGLLLAYIAEALLLYPFVRKEGYRVQLAVDWQSSELRETLYIVLPILLGTSVGQINKFIDKALASTLAEGAVSAMSYASVINNAIQEVLSTGLITILFADCSHLVSKGEHALVKRKLLNVTNIFVVLLIPASVGILLLSSQIVTALLCRGSFDAESVRMTTAAMQCYTVGLCFLAVRDTLVKIFYAYKMTKLVTRATVASVVMGIILKLVLCKPFGMYGLAIATSLSAVIHCVMLYILLYLKKGALGTKQLFVTIVKSLFATTVMAVAVVWIRDGMKMYADIWQLVICALVGVMIYGVAAILLGIPCVCNMFRKKEKLVE